MCNAYDIETHKHTFAVWAASRAASVRSCPFTVQYGKALLEGCGFDRDFATPERLPTATHIDKRHRKWRDLMIAYAADSMPSKRGGALTHGVAAKLINCYLKARFVCGGHHAHERVTCLHPPIDGQILRRFSKSIANNRPREAAKLGQARWSALTSDQYEELIKIIRTRCGGEPLWKIEVHWPGYQ